jgi:D-beta-D-heptose 7-phosphate kinase/D-beta-D-heptose 1-phosphate adenosyltransferase
MDTRIKILSGPHILVGEPLAVVTGYFDVVRAEHVRDLAAAHRRAPHARLLVVVVRGTEPLLPLAARVELVAAIRMVDYVLTADDNDVERLIKALRPVILVRLESDDLHRVSRLKEHVHRQQG